MSVVRVQRRQPGAYLPRDTAHDRRLSPEALGLLAWLLAHADQWEVRVWAIVSEMRERRGARRRGRDYVQRLLRELEAAGYLYRQRRRTACGRWEWISTVSDTPMDVTTTGSATAGSAGHGSAVDGGAGHIRTNDQTNHRSDVHLKSSSSRARTNQDDDDTPDAHDAIDHELVARVASVRIHSTLNGCLFTALQNAGLPTDDGTITRYAAAVRGQRASAAKSRRKPREYPEPLLKAAKRAGVDPADRHPSVVEAEIRILSL